MAHQSDGKFGGGRGGGMPSQLGGSGRGGGYRNRNQLGPWGCVFQFLCFFWNFCSIASAQRRALVLLIFLSYAHIFDLMDNLIQLAVLIHLSAFQSFSIAVCSHHFLSTVMNIQSRKKY